LEQVLRGRDQERLIHISIKRTLNLASGYRAKPKNTQESTGGRNDVTLLGGCGARASNYRHDQSERKLEGEFSHRVGPCGK
jgi:hypothetical protein